MSENFSQRPDVESNEQIPAIAVVFDVRAVGNDDVQFPIIVAIDKPTPPLILSIMYFLSGVKYVAVSPAFCDVFVARRLAICTNERARNSTVKKADENKTQEIFQIAFWCQITANFQFWQKCFTSSGD